MSDNNRIGDACWYKIRENGKWTWKAGILRAWSMDHAESESGPGHFPVAVIEDYKTMRCTAINVNHVTFGAVPNNN